MLTDAIKHRVRYEQPDENGLTRRDRNENFGQEHLTPDVELDQNVIHYFNLYFSISNQLHRVKDGCCSPIPPSEFLSWLTLSKSVVEPWEYDMLCTMDLAYCTEMNAELEAYRQRQVKK